MIKFVFIGIAIFFNSIIIKAQGDIYENVELLIKAYKPSEALSKLDSIENHVNNISSSELQLYRARCFSLLKNYEKAIKICTEILELNGNDTLQHKIYFTRSGMYLYLGKIDSAILDINKAIELNPKEINYYLNASYFYGEIGDYGNYYSSLKKGYNIDPQNISILNNFSDYFSMTENYPEAIYYANEGLKYAKDSIWVGTLFNNRGYAYLGLKKYNEALKDINESIEYFPNNSFAYYYKALVYIELGEIENVCKNLKQAKNFGGINMTKDLIHRYCNP